MVLVAVMALAVAARAGTSMGVSPIITVDLRSALSGIVVGQVLGGGASLSNAQVRVLDTPYATNTMVGGGFTLTNVSCGAGYVVSVAAPGFAPTNIANVSVTASPRNLGKITLRPLGAHKVIVLVPDINPVVSTVEEGGVAYRYYRVVSADGKTPAGGVQLQARLADGGTEIPQSGDIAENWPGRAAGVSDADGFVRVGVPSSAVGSAYTTRRVEVLDVGRVVQSFDVRVTPFLHEKLWGHMLGGSVGGKIYGVKVEPGGKLETEILDYYKGANTINQTIERTRSFLVKAGVEVSTPSLELGSVKAGVKGGAGVYMNAQFSRKWSVPPDTEDGVINAKKSYFAFGDIICLGPGSAEVYGMISDAWYGQDFETQLMVGSGGELHVGGYVNGEAGTGIGTFGNQNVRVGAALETSIGGFLGYEDSYSGGVAGDYTGVFGFEGEAQGEIGATVAKKNYNKRALRGAGMEFSFGFAGSKTGKVQIDRGTKKVKATTVELQIEIARGRDLQLFGWRGVEGALGGDESVKLTEAYTLAFKDANGFDKLTSHGKLWCEVNEASQPESTSSPLLTTTSLDTTGSSLADTANQLGDWLTYERSIKRCYKKEADFPIGLDLTGVGLKFNFGAEVKCGATMVLERGVTVGDRCFPLATSPDQSRNLIPSDTVFEKEAVWLSHADFPVISDFFSRFSEYISTANPNLTIGGRFSMFFHDVADGAQIVGSDLRRWAQSGNTPQQKMLSSAGMLPSLLDQDYLPSDSQTNYIYGVSGLIQLSPGTNVFPGTATVVMLYTDEDVAGLNEADLRIYRLSNATNQWQLVGGIVDAVSNSVTTIISNFGMYAIAPPMPSGTVNLQSTNYNLSADGTSELLLVATNLLLNSGDVASNAWLYTVDASGVTILDDDANTNWPGIQIASSNGVLQVQVRSLVGGTYARVDVSSVVGDARGEVGVNLIDNAPPATPTNILLTAGQSRLWVSWLTNNEPDVVGYRVYYRAGMAGSPWDGTASIEGIDSPVSLTGTNCLLRGLTVRTNYYVSISAVDTTGNESPLSAPVSVTLSQMPPSLPTCVATRFGDDGTNVLMWALSEDDGYNDRDVVRYEIWRMVTPGTSWSKVGEVGAGIGLFSERSPSVGSTQVVNYAVTAMDQMGMMSGRQLANGFFAGGTINQNPVVTARTPATNPAVVNEGASVALSVTANDSTDPDPLRGMLNIAWYVDGVLKQETKTGAPLAITSAFTLKTDTNTVRGVAFRDVPVKAVAMDRQGGTAETNWTVRVKNVPVYQTLTFPVLPVKALGDPDFAPGARASSGLPVVYSNANPAVAQVVDGQIHIVGAGTTVITAYQPGNYDFKAALPLQQTLTVKARLAADIPSGGGTVAGVGLYLPGTKVILTAKPALGNTFLHWEDGSQTAVRSLVMPSSNMMVSAWFGITTNVPKPVITNPGDQNAMVGVPFRMPLEITSDSLPTVTVTGLPSGLAYSAATKAIVGVPAASVTNKLVTVTARNVNKTPETQTFLVTVDPLPIWAVGSFNGIAETDAMGSGSASMSVTALGVSSGKITLRGTNFIYSAKSYSRRDIDGAFWLTTTAKVGVASIPLTLKVRNPPGAVPPNLSVADGWLALTGAGEPGAVMYRNVWKEPGMAAVLTNNYTGYYTATLPGGSEYGSGYLTFTIDKLGGVKTVGKLADGTAVSLAGPLILDEAGRVFAVLYTSPLAYKGGCLFGLAEFVKGEPGTRVTVRLLDDVPCLWENRSPAATQVYGSGFSRYLDLTGGWYDKLGNLYRYYADRTLSVGTETAPVPELVVGTNRYDSVCWSSDGLILTVVTNKLGVMTGLSAPRIGSPEKVGAAYDYATPTNAVGLTIGLTRATGVFKGSFKAWFDYLTTHTSKTIAYEGVLTRERENTDDGVAGRGFFLWRDTSQYLNPQNKVVPYSFSWSYDLNIILSDPVP